MVEVVVWLVECTFWEVTLCQVGRKREALCLSPLMGACTRLRVWGELKLKVVNVIHASPNRRRKQRRSASQGSILHHSWTLPSLARDENTR